MLAVITDDVVTVDKDTFVVAMTPKALCGCLGLKNPPIVTSSCNNNAQHSFKKRSGITASLPHNSNRQSCLTPNY